jgi:uncharacterized protein YqjF (DUF2071 family)
VGSQRWRDLLFVHWPVPADRLRALLPAALALDTFEGVAYLGLVPFAMKDVRPLRGLPPLPTAAAFPETNLRTYVRHQGEPGVWFFSLDAASTLAVAGARLRFGLPYFRADMELVRAGESVRYRSHRRWPGPRPATLELQYTVGAPLGPARPGTREHFLVERYVLFAQRRGALVRGQVRHSPYPLRQAQVGALVETLTSAAGLTHDDGRPPDLYSEGVDVDIFAPAVVRARA